MAAPFLTVSNQGEFIRRIEGLAVDSKASWGTMTVNAMLAHLIMSFRICLEEVPARDQSTIYFKYLVRFIALHSPIPWPRAKMPALEVYLPEPEGEIETQKQALVDALNRFMDAVKADPSRVTIHPRFGKGTLSYWCRFHGRHVDHHLTQFGM